MPSDENARSLPLPRNNTVADLAWIGITPVRDALSSENADYALSTEQ
ncbi:hypothetical protein [Myxacorys almedinensis]|uniref:Uncharacterized protein n=1 Tax=Myxacorys almedinensis A TaxID=2690445 RepID=A0A8J7Z7N0_9CYAN|nr:hypothetical protein [Myxacorys almedinensis]NDJ19421.1 hypothetical protein [Myxacorys almedinensis A]